MSDLRYSCILFDLDGTVIDTVADCASAINRTMDDFGFPHHTDSEVCSYLNNGARMLIRRALPDGLERSEEFITEVLSKYLSYYSEECTKRSQIYPGVLDLLKKLKAHGASLGIVTNKPDIQTKIMTPHFFGDLFGYYEGNSEHAPTKPDAARVDMALSALGKRREDAIFVGDSWVDVETAKNSGIPSVGVAWGFGGKEGFQKSGVFPDIIAETAEDIFAFAKYGFEVTK